MCVEITVYFMVLFILKYNRVVRWAFWVGCRRVGLVGVLGVG